MIHEEKTTINGFRKSLQIVKEGVPVEGYASTLTELRNLRGRCPIHGGDNKHAFAVYPGEARWYCFRCSAGGDVVDLCQQVEGGEAWEAMMILAHRYGIELPNTRTDSWHRWQSEKEQIRAAAKKHLARRYQQRLTRLYSPLVLLGGESTEEALEELEELAVSLWPTSLALAEKRVSGE